MKVKQCILKEDVSIMFTPEEIYELIIICECAKVFSHESMRAYPHGSQLHEYYHKLSEITERMQNKIIELRNKNSVVEEVEI